MSRGTEEVYFSIVSQWILGAFRLMPLSRRIRDAVAWPRDHITPPFTYFLHSIVDVSLNEQRLTNLQ